MTYCRCHCSICGSHFTGLEAFDAHRSGPYDGERICSFPDDAGLVELIGACRIDDPECPKIGVTVYGCKRASGVRDYFRGVEDAHTAPAGLKRRVAA